MQATICNSASRQPLQGCRASRLILSNSSGCEVALFWLFLQRELTTPSS
jgi:hypothetical protein